MVFRLSITVLQTLIDPEKVSDKNEGFTAVIKRVVIGLLLLAALTPINIPNAHNEFEIELNNNGLIFGTLYSLQNRILSNNTIGRIVLGTGDTGLKTSLNDSSKTDSMGSSLSTMANVFTATILRVFVRINMNDDVDTRTADPTDNSNWMCPIESEILKKYTKIDADPAELLDDRMLTTTCSIDNGINSINIFRNNLFHKSDARYAFVYIPIISTIVAVIITVILLGFTVDIAIRAIKLSVLRLIAPIPIIAYMGPNSKDNTAFSNWLKALIATYIDLFVRLAIIFFITFLIQDMLINGIAINISGGIIGGFSMIFIIIGLYVFARQAPKFIQDVLGLKSMGSNIGLASIMGGSAMLLGRGGASGFAQGALSSFEAETKAQAEGKQGPGVMGAWNQGTDLMAQIRTGDKQAHGGALGRLQDRMNFSTRERNAARFNAGNRDLADAEYAEGEAKRFLDAAQKDLAMKETKFKATGSAADEAAYKEAYEKEQALAKVHGKLESKVKAIEKAREAYQVIPRASDTRRNRSMSELANYQFNKLEEDFVNLPENTKTGGNLRSPLEAVGSDMNENDFITQTADGNWVAKETDDATRAAARAIDNHKRDLKDYHGSLDETTIASLPPRNNG